MARRTQPEIHIDDLHVVPDGYTHAYKAMWLEAGLLVTLHLDIVDSGHWRQGHFLTHAYELVSHVETLSGRPPGSTQAETGAKYARELRILVQARMNEAGWQQVDTTHEGQPIYQYRPGPADDEPDLPDIAFAGDGADVPGEDQGSEAKLANQNQNDLLEFDQGNQPKQQRSHIVEVVGSAEAKERGQQPAYSREVFTRPVTFTCIVCGETVTQQRYPGHTPLYCSDACKDERVAERTRERVARHREKKRAEATAAMRSAQEAK